MNVQYCSDLHLEFSTNRNYLKDYPIIPSGEILLLAGDIMPFAHISKFADFIDRLADQFEAIYWVPGNHEYYHFDISSKPIALNEKIRSNFFLVNNQLVQYKDVNLVFSTLWSNISPQNEWGIRQTLNDFFMIMNGERKFTPSDFSSLHRECFSFVESATRAVKSQGDTKTPTVVVTHHVPTLLKYPKQYLNSPLNEAFAVELFDFISDSGIGHWIYGHHHSNRRAPFSIGTTWLLTNQLGYVHQREHQLFRTDAIIKFQHNAVIDYSKPHFVEKNERVQRQIEKYGLPKEIREKKK